MPCEESVSPLGGFIWILKRSNQNCRLKSRISGTQLLLSNQKLEKAQSEPTGPEIMLSAAARDELVVSNKDGGIALNIVVGSFRIGTLVSEEYRISSLAVNDK